MFLLPSEYIKNTIDVYLNQHCSVSQKIYWVTLLAVVIILCSLPFIYVEVSVQDTGIIRPVAEKTEVKASITEFIDSVCVKEGQKVNQGDTLLVFRHSNPDYKINYQQSRLKDYQEHLSDLRLLINGIVPQHFSSNTRRQEYLYFVQQESGCETNLMKATKDLERNQSLFEKGVISEEEYEGYKYEYDKAKNALASLKDNQVRQWQNDLNNYYNYFEEMRASMEQELKEKDRYVVVSPVSGTLDQFKGIYSGSSIQSGSLLAVISPDSTLYAEIYVSPRNIGYIYIDMPVSLQVGSFNYNEWGTISGKVIEISSDFMFDSSGSNPYYRVKCSMDQNYLTRKNGITGMLKKGMTISSHFKITKRSLFDLIYQKMDDWVNPKQYDEKSN